jgi:hypothetical protein
MYRGFSIQGYNQLNATDNQVFEALFPGMIRLLRKAGVFVERVVTPSGEVNMEGIKDLLSPFPQRMKRTPHYTHVIKHKMNEVYGALVVRQVTGKAAAAADKERTENTQRSETSKEQQRRSTRRKEQQQQVIRLRAEAHKKCQAQHRRRSSGGGSTSTSISRGCM